MKIASRSLLTATATAALLTSGLALGGSALAGQWEIDSAHTTAQFSVRHMMVTTVRGQFEKVSGSVALEEKDPTRSSVELEIDAASINTRNEKRDAHLRSPDFFDVANHPKITFKSTKIQKAGKDKYKVTGDLTMRGVTKPVTLTVTGPTAAVKSPYGTMVRGLSATGKISRKEWGLKWNQALEAGGVVVGDEVEIQVDTELQSKDAQAAAATAPAKPPAAAKPAAAARPTAQQP